MATIAQTSMITGGVITVIETTLGASDTFVYSQGNGQILTLRNPTAGALSPTITGSTASAAIPVSGYGTVSAAGGLAVGSIAAGTARAIPLDTVSAYLSGTITVASGVGLVASILTY